MKAFIIWNEFEYQNGNFKLEIFWSAHSVLQKQKTLAFFCTFILVRFPIKANFMYYLV